MPHEVPQHVRWAAVVGVPLGEAVPVGVGHDRRRWKRLPGLIAQLVGDHADELAMRAAKPVRRDVEAASGIAQPTREQR
jgi:hypothetical protein